MHARRYYLNRAAVYAEQDRVDECVAECGAAVQIGRENRATFAQIAKAFARAGNALFKAKRCAQRAAAGRSACFPCATARATDVSPCAARVSRVPVHECYDFML